MNKTIKIIDLFNAIANEEKIPKRIKYGCNEYVFNTRIRDYIYIAKEGSVPRYFIDLLRCQDLNDEVEIIEESEQEEIVIQELQEYEFPAYADIKLNIIERKLLELINENRQAIKQLDKKIKEK